MSDDSPLSPQHQQANRYALSVEDMDQVIEYLTCCAQLEKMPDTDPHVRLSTARHGLLSAAIVAYCRPFSDNNSRGFAVSRLAERKFDSVVRQRALHDRLINKRNSFVAHADWKARNIRILDVGQEEMSMVPSAPDLWAEVDLSEFERLARGVRQECVANAVDQALCVSSLTSRTDV